MNISYNWLRKYVDIDLDPYELADKLTIHGLEVDAVEQTGSNFEGVVIGDIKEVNDHSNADRLKLCQVDIGDETVQIVCGAPNVKAGQKVPVATVGAELPITLDDGSPLVIKKAKLRGETSRGMICAEDELGLGDDHSGIMVLDTDLPAGTAFTKLFPPNLDYIFDIELTPNRPDAACHLGVARDVAAFTESDLTYPEIPEHQETSDLAEHIDITIENPEKCHRYVGMVIKDATIQESPIWLKSRLEAIGVRPVNAVVDATNFVLHEMGQPLHAFDYDLLSDQKIVVKDFDETTKFATLDHVERDVLDGTLFICDGQQPVAIAGVMGGLDSEISDETTNILLESAYFDPSSIRRAAKNLGLQTDASYRFERGIDPNMTLDAAYRCAELIADLTDGTLVPGHADIHPKKTEPKELPLRLSYINRLLGRSFTAEDVADILERLEIKTTNRTEDKLTVSVPTFRPDLEREVDLIEEVGRIYDYNNLPMPEEFSVSELTPLSAEQKLQNRVKDLLKSHGFSEIYTNSLLSVEHALQYAPEESLIHTMNPISKDQAVMRTSLQHGFLQTVSYNMKRDHESLRFYEFGHVFERDEEGTYFPGYAEDIRFSLGLAGYKHTENWRTEAQKYDVFDLKAHIAPLLDQLNLSEKLQTKAVNSDELHYLYDDQFIGRLTRVEKEQLDNYDISLPAFYAEFSFSTILRIHTQEDKIGKSQQYRPVPKFPSFSFDLALVVDHSIPAGDLMHEIRKTAGPLLEEISIFDVFEGESVGKGKKSIAFRLRFLDREKTLTIDNVEPIINKILNRLEKEFSATLRS